jgi:iron complex transport system ATP-binding protein
MTDSLLSCSHLDVVVAQRRLVCALDLAVRAGEVICLLGPNGAGKSLTLHTLAGLRPITTGTVTLSGRPITEWGRRERARRLGLLTQVSEDPFPGTVLEAVLIGRHPHVDPWQWESDADIEAARLALSDCDLEGFEQRALSTLSGGERRRVALAAVLAQDPDILLLDEPQNHLDPKHQLAVLRLLRRRAEQGRAAIVSLHDASLAARLTDRALLLFGDGQWSFGNVAETLTPPALSRLYGVTVSEAEVGGQRFFIND